jgi:type VI protein secretion system component Hcp
MKTTLTLATLLAGALLLLSSPALAQDMNWYAEADTISGCSTAPNYSGWIEIDAVHHLWYRPEQQVSDPLRKQYILTRRMDCSTISFWEALRQQTHINQLELHAVEGGGQLRTLQIIKFGDVRIENIETADDFPDEAPVERVRFSYDGIEIESRCYDSHGSCGTHLFSHSFSKGVK